VSRVATRRTGTTPTHHPVSKHTDRQRFRPAGPEPALRADHPRRDSADRRRHRRLVTPADRL